MIPGTSICKPAWKAGLKREECLTTVKTRDRIMKCNVAEESTLVMMFSLRLLGVGVEICKSSGNWKWVYNHPK